MVRRIEASGYSSGAIARACVVVAALVLAGCGRPAPETRTDVPDPAMSPPPAAITAAPALDAGEPEALREPTSLTYDDISDRIFVPGAGWFAAEEFWDLYLNDPASLPADLDLWALHELREQWQARQLAVSE